jgi:gliding motility-associated lipoprotein GldD
MIRIGIALAGLFFLIGCGDDRQVPRPRAYPRIEYPVRDSLVFNKPDCPFTFQYPSYAEIKDKEEACWFDIFMPAFNARIHCSYLPVKSTDEYNDLVRDAFVIANKINERANFMEESRIMNPQGVGGLLLNWTGPAASPVHFFVSDTTAHFFKAALYFDSRVQPDSLAPIVTFLKEDIDKMISSFAWKR